MNKYFILTAIAVLGFNGCSNSIDAVNAPSLKSQPHQKPSEAKSSDFKSTMKEVAFSTRDDAKYNKMALDTPEKKTWFKDLMFRLWDKQITKNQFIAEGIAKYHTHEYEFSFVADGFLKRS